MQQPAVLKPDSTVLLQNAGPEYEKDQSECAREPALEVDF